MENFIFKVQTQKKLCPFLNEPFDECYCYKMSSQDIERAIYLCSSHFDLCEIYKNKNGNGKGNKSKYNDLTVRI